MNEIYSPHAEEGMIGAVLIDDNILNQIDLPSEDFYIHSNRFVWEAITSLRRRGSGIDFVTVGDELQRMGKLNEIGGPSKLLGYISDTARVYSADDYAGIIREKANRRRVMQAANDLAKAATDETKTLDVSVADVMSNLATSAAGRSQAVHWSRYLTQAADFIDERAQNPGGVWGIRTGFDEYDFMTGGMQLTELLLITGEPGVGKSIFQMQLAMQIAGIGKVPGALYSLEMLGRAVALRAISAKSQITTKKLKSGSVGDDEWTGYNKALEELDAMPLYMSDSSEWTTTGLRADLSRLKLAHGIKWFAVDYSYLLCDGGGKLNPTEKTEMVIKNLKMISMSLGLAGIAIHSMTKEGMNGTQTGLAGMRGSGQNAYDADLVLSLTIPDKANPNIITATLVKGREVSERSRSFDLVRQDGIPWYRTGATRTVKL